MAEPEVLTKFSDDFRMCTITLNRPSKLNALNLNMIRLLHQAVDQVDAKSSALGCLILDGAGEKAFCAGGDVHLIREEALAGGSLPADFFFEEYGIVFRLATLLQRTGCCQVSLFDGITMGGGVGLGAHGPIRIVTEKTRFAMPEMAIGLFPDVGATYLLSHLKAGPNVGRFLGMTGTTINTWDCLAAGVGTHFVPSARIEHLRQSLSARLSATPVTGADAMAVIEEAIRDAAAGAQPEPNGAVLTAANLEVIERCFSAPSVEDIVSRLRINSGSFAKAALEKLFQSCSPTSCKVTLEAMRRVIGERLDITGVLQMEYRLSQRFTTRPQPLSDFYEGIRAVLVDKDRKQKWNPGWDRLNEVSDANVKVFFSSLETGHKRGELHLDKDAFSESVRPPFPPVTIKSQL